MERTIISHNLETGKARIRFVHNEIEVEQDYDLLMVVPGSAWVLAEMQIPFDEEMQMKAMDKLTASITNQIEDGTIQPALPSLPPVDNTVPDPVAPSGDE